MKNYFRQNIVLVITLFVIIILSISRILSDGKPYASGDGIEYTLMTEALYNHSSPNVETTDCESFKDAYTKKNKWTDNDKYPTYDTIEKFVKNNNCKLLDNVNAFFADKYGKKYSDHFFFYSLLNVPVRWVCSLYPFNPLQIFHITNALLIIISCFVFLRYSPYDNYYTSAFVLLFFYSTNYWYFCWPHPEVFTICFVTVGLWMFFQKKYYLGIVLVSLAALQNQPIVVLSFVLCCMTLFTNGFRFKNILNILLCSFWILLPSLFYYYHFSITSLVQYKGFLDTGDISWQRFSGFFFDLNQGMILAFPFILMIYLILIFSKTIKMKSAEYKWDLLLVPSIIGMTCIACTMVNWNHGQAIVNRYVTYIGAVVLVHFFMLVMQIQTKIIRNSILLISIVTQFITVIYFKKMNYFDWSAYQPKPMSDWVLKNHPRFYNPDPMIFIERYARGMADKLETSPAFYMKEDGTITKILVHKKYLTNLESFKISKKQIDSLALNLTYINDWAYIDVSDKFTPVLSDERKIMIQVNAIKADDGWYQLVQEKAKKMGITEEEALKRDAAYMLKIDIKKNETKTEKIQDKINEMKADASWRKLLEAKANEQKLPVDTVMYYDALWMVENENSK